MEELLLYQVYTTTVGREGVAIIEGGQAKGAKTGVRMRMGGVYVMKGLLLYIVHTTAVSTKFSIDLTAETCIYIHISNIVGEGGGGHDCPGQGYERASLLGILGGEGKDCPGIRHGRVIAV